MTMSQPLPTQPPKPGASAPAWIQSIALMMIALVLVAVFAYVIYLRYSIENRIEEAFGTEPTAEPSASCYDPANGGERADGQPYC
jgi:hypothetical protein